MILFGNISFEESKAIFTRIIETYPGIASKIIRDNIINEYIESLPSDEQCAEMIFTCMNTWVKSLGLISKIILIILMFFGRLGGLTLIYATLGEGKQQHYKYPVEKIIVG